MDEEGLFVGECVEVMGGFLGWEFKREYLEGAIASFVLIKAEAGFVNEFFLPDNIEVAPVFEP